MVKTTSKNKIGPNNLEEIRVKEGLKKSQLARLANVSARIISDIEKGKTNSTPETRNKIIKGLNKNPEKKKNWTHDEVFPNS